MEIRGKSAGELADEWHAELATGRPNAALERAVQKQFQGGQEYHPGTVGTLDQEESPLEKARAVLQGILDAR